MRCGLKSGAATSRPGSIAPSSCPSAPTIGVTLGRWRRVPIPAALFFFFKQKTASEIGLGIPAEPLFRSANGRLHFHAVHFMRTLPTGSVDPNFGRRVRNRRQLNSLQNTWPYGYSMPIAVRYTQDAFSRSGWLWPVDAKGEPLKATS